MNENNIPPVNENRNRHSEHDPVVYLMRQNGKRIAVCLSTFGKWVTGVLATLIAAGFIAVFGLIWSSAENSREALLEIRQVRENIERYESTNDERHRDFEQRLRDIERKDKV